ncbi:MAG: NUDIX domain-containing protein [Capsulimonadales bacterium]|nr:NUDIX domain-containing protein [Capsulimonadales bacterium]
MISFPTVRWKREWATFVASSEPPVTDIPAPAALVFPFYGDRVVLADIVTRGWCIPSGHIESGETAEAAVRREAMEEAGAILGEVRYIGYFILTETTSGGVRHAPTFIATVQGLTEVPVEHESRGRQLANAEDIAALYFSWDDLLAAVFMYAWREKAHLARGMSLASFTDGQK